MRIKKNLFLILVLFFFFEVTFVNSFSAGGKGAGGGTVSITNINLAESGTNYSMKPGRLKFEFDEKLYAIQVRRIKEEYVDFLIMTLDMNKQEDITAYTLDDSFSLKSEGKREIDLNKDGTNDILIELKGVIPVGKHNSLKSADFSIKKIDTQKEETDLIDKILEDNSTEIIIPILTGNVIQEPISESVIALNQESKEQSTFLDKVTGWFKGLFK